MKCPKCGEKMLKANKSWECSKCGCILISNSNEDATSKTNNSLENKFGKLIGNVGNIKEQVSVQVKKEEAYIKSRLDDDSTALVDDNEFFISKSILDGVDYITNKKQKFEKERTSKNQNKNTTSVKVDDTINQETEKPKKETQKTDEPNYPNLELSDLQETLINTLPLIDNPSEYEENIINKYAEYNSEQRKELLKDCWTVTRLAEKHNIKRHEVEKAILSDEFLNKDLIGVFKVNPNNIRSLKILYRKPLTETSTKTIIKESKEPKDETSTRTTQNNKKIYKKTKTQGKKRGLFSKKSPELKNFEKELLYYLGGTLGDGFGDSNYYISRENELNMHLNPSGNVKTILIDEFENGNVSMDNLTTRIDELIVLDTLSLIRYMLRKGYDTSVIKTQDELYEFLKEKYNVQIADKSNLKVKIASLGVWGFGENPHIKDILMNEFEEGNLSLNDVETRIKELRELDIGAMKMQVLDKGHDTSVIKTQEELYEFLKDHYGMKVAEDSNKKQYRKEALFEKYGINPDETYFFECTIEERRSSTFSNTDKRNVDHAYVALYDDYIAIIKESVWLKSDMGMRKVYFNNVTSIDYDTAGKLGMSSSLFIHMHSGEHVQLKHITKERVDEIQKRFEKYTNEKNNNAGTVQINQETTSADELLKYAELYKQGLLSEEEFEAKKKELL